MVSQVFMPGRWKTSSFLLVSLQLRPVSLTEISICPCDCGLGTDSTTARMTCPYREKVLLNTVFKSYYICIGDTMSRS